MPVCGPDANVPFIVVAFKVVTVSAFILVIFLTESTIKALDAIHVPGVTPAVEFNWVDVPE